MSKPVMNQRPRRERRARRAGYTMIEVMMAVAVLTTGATGIFALQTAATRGNFEARQMTTGSQMVQNWLERLRRDSLNWVTPANTADLTLLARTTYLRNVTAPANAAAWVIPVPAAASGETANFDFYGRDTADRAEMQYCTNIRLTWLYPGNSMRADVRVWWLRRASGTNGVGNTHGQCAPGIATAVLTGDRRLRMAHGTTILRNNRPTL